MVQQLTSAGNIRILTLSTGRHDTAWVATTWVSFLLSLCTLSSRAPDFETHPSICTWKLEMILQGSKALLHCEVYWSKIEWFLFRTPNQGISIMCGDTWLLLNPGSVNHIVKIDWTWLAYFCPLFLRKTISDSALACLAINQVTPSGVFLINCRTLV